MKTEFENSLFKLFKIVIVFCINLFVKITSPNSKHIWNVESSIKYVNEKYL